MRGALGSEHPFDASAGSIALALPSRDLGAQVSRLLANRFIFTQGDRTRHFYLIEQGSVRVFYQSRNGSEFTPAVLAHYVSSFHPRLIGLTGTPEQIRTVANSYKAYYAKYTPPSGGVYLIDHTGFTYLMDRAG